MRLFYQKSIYLSIYLSMYTDKIRLLGFTTLSKIRYDCWVILSYLISVSILDLLSIRGLFFLSLSILSLKRATRDGGGPSHGPSGRPV
jgi:hypothetical protein